VITALPVNGNPGVAFNANDAVVALDEDTDQLDVPKNEPEYIPNPVVLPPDNTSTFSLLSALEAEMVRDDETAQEAVPVNAPTNEPVKEPVMGEVKLLSWSELDIVPAGNPDGIT
jgi:hypothetical protein